MTIIKKSNIFSVIWGHWYPSLMVDLCSKLCQALSWNTYQIEQCKNCTLKEEIFPYLCQIREIKFLRKIICIIIVTLFWFYQFLKFSITNNFINLSWTMQAILNIRQAPHQMTQGSRKILVPVRVLIRQIMWKRTSHLAMQASNNIDSL